MCKYGETFPTFSSDRKEYYKKALKKFEILDSLENEHHYYYASQICYLCLNFEKGNEYLEKSIKLKQVTIDQIKKNSVYSSYLLKPDLKKILSSN